jgi:ribosomal protein S12 methylthiotransferase accessory factor
VALRKAALEVGQVRPALRARLRRPETRARLEELLSNVTLVAELDDHDLLYAHPSQLEHLGRWLDAPEADPPPATATAADPASTLAAVVDDLAGRGVDVAYVNLTPPDIGEYGISVVRVHATELQPIHFGAHEARLGGTRLFTFGADGKGGRAATADELNLRPHPLA